MTIIGIDPGFTGALCVIRGDEVMFHDMPLMDSRTGKNLINSTELAGILRRYHSDGGATITLERVGAMPRQGSSSTFRFGEGYGIVQGVAAALGIPVQFVTPQVWKKAVGLQGAEKDYSRTLAIQRFPAIAPHLARKKDIGRADAFWLAMHHKPKGD